MNMNGHMHTCAYVIAVAYRVSVSMKACIEWMKLILLLYSQMVGLGNGYEVEDWKELYIMEIENKSADCIFTIGENRNADLKCQIDLDEYQELNTFTFKIF